MPPLGLPAPEPGVVGVGQVADLDHQRQDDQSEDDGRQGGRQDQDQPFSFGPARPRGERSLGDGSLAGVSTRAMQIISRIRSSGDR